MAFLYWHFFAAQFGAALGILLASVDISFKNRNLPILALLGFCYAAVASRVGLKLVNTTSPHAFIGFLPALWALGPCVLYLAFKMFEHKEHQGSYMFLNFLPALLLMGAELTLSNMVDYDLRFTLLNQGVYGAKTNIIFWFICAGIFHLALYLFITMLLYFGTYRRLDLKYPGHVVAFMIVLFFIGTCFLGVGFAFDLISLYVAGIYTVTISMTLALITRLKYHTFLQDFRQAVQEKRYETTSLDNINVKHIQTELIDLMSSQKIYRRTELRLPHLADLLGLSTNQLSRLINEAYGKRFNEFINEYRIQEACEQLTSTSLSILEIAYSVGFNNISTFNIQFKKLLGCRPIDFRKQKKKVDENKLSANLLL